MSIGITANDQRLLQLYTRFQERRQHLPSMSRPARYDDFVDHGRYDAASMPVVMLAQEHILAAANSINKFWDYLHRLVIWDEILCPLTETDKVNVFFEFVSLLADHCLSAPYSIKQTLIKSVCVLSYETSRFCGGGGSTAVPFKRDKALNFKYAETIAHAFAGWPVLSTALSELNDESYLKKSDDYRNRLNHGFPRYIEFGSGITIERERAPSGGMTYNMRSPPPLRISDLIPVLQRQYGTAYRCYGLYLTLIKEQHKLWPRS